MIRANAVKDRFPQEDATSGRTLENNVKSAHWTTKLALLEGSNG
jgi:hypothetical protein